MEYRGSCGGGIWPLLLSFFFLFTDPKGHKNCLGIFFYALNK